MEWVILLRPLIDALFEKCTQRRMERAFANADGNKRQRRRFARRLEGCCEAAADAAIAEGELDPDDRAAAVKQNFDYYSNLDTADLKARAMAACKGDD